MIITQWFLWLIIYSFIGWIYESTVCSIAKRRPINRGFLNGPICPVYGFGALTSILVLYGRTDNIFILFFAGMFLTTVVEYITAWLLEKLFKAKWWDYSQRRFNLHGRVCLLGAVVFGVLSVLLIKYIHPFVSGLIATMSRQTLYIVTTASFVAMMVDLIITIRHLLRLNSNLKEFQAAFNQFRAQQAKRADELKAAFFERFEQSEFYKQNIRQRFEKIRMQSARMAHAYPKLRSLDYNEAWERLKALLQQKRQNRPRQ